MADSSTTATGGLSPLCACSEDNTPLPIIQAAAHPYNNVGLVLCLHPSQEVAPMFSKNYGCKKKANFNGKLSIRYHVFSHGVYDHEIGSTVDDPTGDNLTPSLRPLDMETIRIRGFNHVYGDQPGYSKGREITTESGKIKAGLLDTSVYEEVPLSVKQSDVEGNSVIELKGCSNKYIKTIVLYYNGVDVGSDVRFHAVFKFDVSSSDVCNSTNILNEQFYKQEAIIDNIGVVLAKQNDNSKGYIEIDARYHLADTIQLWGTKLDIVQDKAICLNAGTYHSSVINTQNFSSAFDSFGRLFVFYEDRKTFSKTVTGDEITCKCSSSSSSSFSSSSSSTASVGGGGGFTGGGAGGGDVGSFFPGGGGGAWANPFGSLIPLPGPSTSSSSSAPVSSSSSLPLLSSSSSSSSSAAETCLGAPGGCNGCPDRGKKLYNSFTVSFGGFRQEELCIKCDSCEGESGFLHIDPADIAGPFCLIQDCSDTCVWENTVYIPAISKKCANISCEDEFYKILIPIHIKAVQGSRWTLTATALDTDCKEFMLFAGTSVGADVCDIPPSFKNDLNLGGYNGDSCCVCFPQIKEVCNISVAMSPDMGQTWYDFKGIIRTVEGELARKPVVTHDKYKNRFHLFYILQGPTVSGLFHKSIDATMFDVGDAFVDYIPPKTFNADSDDDLGLLNFTARGRNIRKAPSSIVSGELPQNEMAISVTRNESGFSYRFDSAKNGLSFITIDSYLTAQNSIFYAVGDPSKDATGQNEYSSYVDNKGKLFLYHYGKRGTLPLDKIDAPDSIVGGTDFDRAMLEARVSQISPCSVLTITISGLRNFDCECAKINGTEILKKKASKILDIESGLLAYESENWKVHLDDTYWMFQSKNGMLTCRVKRNSMPCPPIGPLGVVCNRCLGDPIVTIDAVENTGTVNNAYVGTVRPFDAIVRIFSSTDDGKTWSEEDPGRGGHAGSLAYDSFGNYLYSLYVTDNMLFVRRYPGFLYKPFTDSTVSKTVYTTTIIPIESTFEVNAGAASATEVLNNVGDLNAQLAVPMDYTSTTISEKETVGTILKSEIDKSGLPVFLSGEKTGDFNPPANYPYPNNFTFNRNIAVGNVKPAGFITANGALRFFYIDAYGNLGGGYLLSNLPILDSKRKPG